MMRLILASICCLGLCAGAAAQDFTVTTGSGNGGNGSTGTAYNGSLTWPDTIAAPLVSNQNYPNPFATFGSDSQTTNVFNITQWNAKQAERKSMEQYYWDGHIPAFTGTVTGSASPPGFCDPSSASCTNQTIGAMQYHYVDLAITNPSPGNGGTHHMYLDYYVPIASGCGIGSGNFPNGVPRNGPYPVIISGMGSDPVINPPAGGAELGQAELQSQVCRGYIVAEWDRDYVGCDTLDCGSGYSTTSPYTLYPYDVNGVTGYDWGVETVWAWGYSRVMDYLSQQPNVDTSKFITIGVSRDGTASTLGGLYDPRAALIVNVMGTAAYWRFVGSQDDFTIDTEVNGQGQQIIPGYYSPHESPFTTYTSTAKYQPIDFPDQIANIAPRPFLIIHSVNSGSTDPISANNAFYAAKKVYEALGVPDRLGLYFNTDPHAMLAPEWEAALDFADKTFFNYITFSANANSVAVPHSPTDWWSAAYGVGAGFLVPSTQNWQVPNLVTGSGYLPNLDGAGQSAVGINGPTFCSTSINATAGDILVMTESAGNQSSITPTVSSISGNSLTWHPVTAAFNGVTFHSAQSGTLWTQVGMYWAAVGTTGTYTVTANYGSTADGCGIAAYAINGVNNSAPLDPNAAAVATTATDNTELPTSTISTSCYDDLVVEATGFNGTSSPATQTIGNPTFFPGSLLTVQPSGSQTQGQFAAQAGNFPSPATLSSKQLTFGQSWTGNVTIAAAFAGSSCAH